MQTRLKSCPEMSREQTKSGHSPVCVGTLGRSLCSFRPKPTCTDRTRRRIGVGLRHHPHCKKCARSGKEKVPYQGHPMLIGVGNDPTWLDGGVAGRRGRQEYSSILYKSNSVMVDVSTCNIHKFPAARSSRKNNICVQIKYVPRELAESTQRILHRS